MLLTERCNFRCKMCPIWKRPHKNELTQLEFEKIFSSKVLRDLVTLSMDGGEPFLRSDIVDIIKAAADRIPNLADLRLVTNGYLSDRIFSSLNEILSNTDLHISVKISVDGIESEHDKIRGVPGAFSRAILTLRRLKELRKKGLDISVSLGFTGLDENVHEIWELYERFGDEFEFFFKPRLSLQHGKFDSKSGLFYSISEQTNEILIKFSKYFMEKEFQGNLTLKQCSRKLFYKYQLDHLENPDLPSVPCSAYFSSLFIDALGNVFPCSAIWGVNPTQNLGNVREKPLDEIWYSSNSYEIRKKIKTGRCSCYSACDLAPSLATSKWPQILFDYIVHRFSSRAR